MREKIKYSNKMINIKNKKGFTLVELLVSISIIATISGIFLANYRKTNSKADVRMVAQKLASEIRTVQNYALSLKSPLSPGGVADEGWAIRFEKGSGDILVYADMDVPFKKYRTVGTDVLHDTIVLPGNIKVYDNRINGNITEDDNFLYITVRPPNPDIFICGANIGVGADLDYPDLNCSTNGNFVEIVIIYGDDLSTTSTILVNKFGLVDVI